MLAALDYILRNAAKYNVDEDVFATELQQLGLPIDSTKVIAKQYGTSKEAMREYFATQSLRLPRLEKVDWRVDYILSSSDITALEAPSVRLNLQLSKEPNEHPSKQLSFELTADKFRLLLTDLRSIHKMMDAIS
eukprot:TRINITY_DN75517_c0_g1_i2.p1 TRINITY_DN75517_c0_g1~~TRINITY_DN75517_c0_g1_i2.p1  ORF type:complete len:134 (-),score=17.75 TRINITY_DN75517_c0_g1_i2:95-496(-)